MYITGQIIMKHAIKYWSIVHKHNSKGKFQCTYQNPFYQRHVNRFKFFIVGTD